MTKNKSFNTTYSIRVKGITTNGFIQKVIERYLNDLIAYINVNHKQIEAELEVSNED